MKELHKIYEAIDEFAADIKSRMAQKHREGYLGWDKDFPVGLICNQIIKDAADFQVFSAHNKIPADIGARAMMLWFRQKHATTEKE